MEIKRTFLIPLILLVVGFVLGTVFMYSGGATDLDINERLEVENAPFLAILSNNLLMCMLFVAGCGVLSSVMALLQGFSFGAILGIWLTVGNPATDFALLFLPHVIFEVAAMIVASMIGFSILRYLVSSKKENFLLLVRSQIPALCVVCLCVLAGALVESFLTPALYNLVA